MMFVSLWFSEVDPRASALVHGVVGLFCSLGGGVGCFITLYRRDSLDSILLVLASFIVQVLVDVACFLPFAFPNKSGWLDCCYSVGGLVGFS